MKIKRLQQRGQNKKNRDNLSSKTPLHLFYINIVGGKPIFEYLCSMKRKITIVLALLAITLMHGCKEVHENPNYPNGIVNFTIYPNTIHEYELNTVGGFKYYTSDPLSTSRGIIVYRLYQDEFRAYDRLPPNNPSCQDANGNLTRLVVDLPFVIDNCNGIKYNIINGDIFEGDGIYPLIQYHTSFDGSALRIYN